MAGAPLKAGRPRASLTRVAARLTTPVAYLAVLGGLQVLLLWMLRAHVGTWLALIGAGGVVALLGLIVFVQGRWRLKLWCITAVAALTAIGPTLVGIIERPRIGLTMEHDGLLQVESAIDRLLSGQPIYGVDWSTTQMARLPWDMTAGPNPALHHLAYFPLTVLVGVPFRLLTRTLGLPFDYRIVLIGFALVGLLAIGGLPIAANRRFMVITAIFLSPLITLYLWAGRNDIEFLAVVLLSLALLSRGHPIPAALALGVAVALKPFALMAVPFLLLVLAIRWRARPSRHEVVLSLAALALAPAVTILPFLIANPTALWTDVVLYPSGGVRDAYPIAGYGFGEFLYEAHLIAHRSDSFPFGVFQLLALVPVVWITASAFLRRPTIGRWMAGYALALLAFAFFARFFNDSYVGVVITLFLCVRPVGDLSLKPAPSEQAGQLVA
ncbi:MAG TPA: glycosyltransferase 87 family protein [Candidatus Dormibacteraeota bacterium]|nr:glycosyltransferase 87 family protein [Candidatus Dormibacteraeota bacterium]